MVAQEICNRDLLPFRSTPPSCDVIALPVLLCNWVIEYTGQTVTGAGGPGVYKVGPVGGDPQGPLPARFLR